jgi:hypothetical protein
MKSPDNLQPRVEVKTPWQHLSRLEQRLLVPKLIDCETEGELPSEADHERAGVVFDGIAVDENAEANSAEMIAQHVLTARNLLAHCGAYRDSPVWKMITRIHGFRKSYIELSVEDRDKLLNHLEGEDYVINFEPFWSSHKFDSARKRTTTSYEPSLHFVNDRAKEPNYGPTYFFVHWDANSVWFGKANRFWRWVPGGRWIEGLLAGLRHKHGFAAPESVRKLLAREGIKIEQVEEGRGDVAERGDVA